MIKWIPSKGFTNSRHAMRKIGPFTPYPKPKSLVLDKMWGYAFLDLIKRDIPCSQSSRPL